MPLTIKRKHVNTHDLRRAFGLRWSARVIPATLQQLMRHESIETTMRYCLGRDAIAVADALCSVVEGWPDNKTGNNWPSCHAKSAEEKPQPTRMWGRR